MRNLRMLGVRRIVACDPLPERRHLSETECGATTVADLDAALEHGLDVGFVTTPSHLHLQQAQTLADARLALFVEKPLSHTAEGVDGLVALVRERGLNTMVGCNMRFHHGPSTMKALIQEDAIGPVISAHLDAGQYMPDWHPGTDYRLRYSANRSMGGGVVLDAIHEIDCARWLFGEVKGVFCYGGKRSRLEIDVEDTADIFLQFESGSAATVHVDYIQRVYSRSCKIIGERGTIRWEMGEPVRVYSADSGDWRTFESPGNYTVNDMYVAELEYFLDCVQRDQPTMADVADGSRVLRVAFAARESMRSGHSCKL